MKISFECECILLQKTLLLFCDKFAATRVDCDFIVSDTKLASVKPLFLIGRGAHIDVPFCKNELFARLEEFYSAIQLKTPNVTQEPKISGDGANLEAQISALVENFKRDLLAIIRSSHG